MKFLLHPVHLLHPVCLIDTTEYEIIADVSSWFSGWEMWPTV